MFKPNTVSTYPFLTNNLASLSMLLCPVSLATFTSVPWQYCANTLYTWLARSATGRTTSTRTYGTRRGIKNLESKLTVMHVHDVDWLFWGYLPELPKCRPIWMTLARQNLANLDSKKNPEPEFTCKCITHVTVIIQDFSFCELRSLLFIDTWSQQGYSGSCMTILFCYACKSPDSDWTLAHTRSGLPAWWLQMVT